MCGFFVDVQCRPGPHGAGSLTEVLDSLRHRGPDASGEYVGNGEGWRVRLAHTRLKILDLTELAAQPMAGRDSRVRLVFNGEIYDHGTLRAELRALGHRFVSTSDTEVLLRALEEWGTDALPRLRGMFAFALFDGRDGSLLLARDRLGIKPLYVSLTAESIAAASEVRALLAAGSVPYRIDPEAVASYLAFGSVSRPHSILQGVTELPPATWLRFRGGRVETGQYWGLGATAPQCVDRGDAVQEVQRRLERAVTIHLESDVPLGIFLSGGLDSRAVAALAARELGSRLETFTVAFPQADHEFNEDADAASVARSLGLRHHVLRVDSERCLRCLDQMLEALDQPSVDGLNTFVVAEEVKAAGITVALSGLGGDEVFGGYPHLRAAEHYSPAWRAAGALGFLPRLARLARPQVAGTTTLHKAAALLGALGDSSRLYAARRGLFLLPSSRALLAPTLAEALGQRDSASLLSTRVEDANLAQAQTLLELGNYLPNTLLRDADVMSMRHALEVRVPMLDHELVEFVLALPTPWRFHRARLKPLLVDALDPHVAGDRSSAKKMGFTLPFVRWMRGPLRSRVDQRIRTLAWAGEFVRVAEAVQLLERFLAGQDRLWTRVWSIFVLDHWLEQMSKRAPALRRGA